MADQTIKADAGKPKVSLQKRTEPADHPMCIECEYKCKQYITADILSCKKLKNHGR